MSNVVILDGQAVKLTDEEGNLVMDLKIGEKAWWNAFYPIALACRELLIQFRNAPDRSGLPCKPGMSPMEDDSFYSMEEWNEILDKMINAFGLVALEGSGLALIPEDAYREIEDGLLEFAAHIFCLWD